MKLSKNYLKVYSGSHLRIIKPGMRIVMHISRWCSPYHITPNKRCHQFVKKSMLRSFSRVYEISGENFEIYSGINYCNQKYVGYTFRGTDGGSSSARIEFFEILEGPK